MPKRVVVISGAGGEIGRAIAERFAKEGASLALLDRTEELAEPAVKAAKENGARQVIGLAADQVRADAVDAAVNEAVAKFGRLDVVVANAGYARLGSILDMSPKTWDLHININLNGTFYLCQAAARHMAEARLGGTLILTSSCLATTHSDQSSAYCASKTALLMLTRSLAAELGIHRIRANAVLPGVIETGMTRSVLDQPGCREALLSETPIGRLGSPGDIADAISFLASDRASFITGASLLVDGGQSIYGQPRWMRQDRTQPYEPTWLAAGEDEAR